MRPGVHRVAVSSLRLDPPALPRQMRERYSSVLVASWRAIGRDGLPELEEHSTCWPIAPAGVNRAREFCVAAVRCLLGNTHPDSEPNDVEWLLEDPSRAVGCVLELHVEERDVGTTGRKLEERTWIGRYHAPWSIARTKVLLFPARAADVARRAELAALAEVNSRAVAAKWMDLFRWCLERIPSSVTGGAA